MKRQEFLIRLSECLDGLPKEDMQKSLDYYAEMIDDKIEDGLTEEQAVAQIGSPEEIAKTIFKEVPITKRIKSRIKSKRELSGAELALIIIGSPIWLSLLIATFAVVFSVAVAVLVVGFAVVVTLYAVLCSLYAGVFAIGACAVAGVVYSFVASISLGIGQGLFFMGAGLFLAGLAILLFFGCNLLAKCVFKLTKWLALLVKKTFKKFLNRGGKKNEN